MGNYEGLMYESDPRLFFLLMIKCRTKGCEMGAEECAFVAKRSGFPCSDQAI
jgi:damage-control phosphatase, subfamily I